MKQLTKLLATASVCGVLAYAAHAADPAPAPTNTMPQQQMGGNPPPPPPGGAMPPPPPPGSVPPPPPGSMPPQGMMQPAGMQQGGPGMQGGHSCNHEEMKAMRDQIAEIHKMLVEMKNKN